MTIRKSRSTVVTVAVFTLVAATVPLAPPAGARPTCFGRRATKVGTKGPDTIDGTRRNDVIVARGGQDFIDARGGNDLICAGRGFDLVFGGPGHDKMKGQRGFDILVGMGGRDVLQAGPGPASILSGGRSSDRLVGRGGIDQAEFFDAGRGVTVDLESGVASGQGNDVLVNIEFVIGSAFDDTLTGTAGTNQLVGGAGEDRLISGGNSGDLDDPETQSIDLLIGDGDPESPPGNDTMQGGPGLNIVFFTLSEAGVDVDLSDGTATGEGSDTLTDIQAVAGSDFDDTMIGDDQNNGFVPSLGDDSITGGAGEDVGIFSSAENGVVADLANGTATGEGTDTFTELENLWGSTGPDRLTGDGADNDLFGFGGADQLSGLAGDDLLNGGPGVDSADGGDGTDTCLLSETKTGCEEEMSGPAALHAWTLRMAPLPMPARWQRLLAPHLLIVSR